MASSDKIIVCLSCGAANRVPEGKSLAPAKCGRCAQGLATPDPVDISESLLPEILAKDTGAFVIDIWAPWCGPCRMMAPHYQSAAARFSDDVRFLKLNSDDNPSAGARFHIRGVPTLVAWQNGRQVAQQPGAQTGPALEIWIRDVFKLTPSLH